MNINGMTILPRSKFFVDVFVGMDWDNHCILRKWDNAFKQLRGPQLTAEQIATITKAVS